MSGHCLTLNAGSSSLKFALFSLGGDETPLLSGIVDRIGQDTVLKASTAGGTPLTASGQPLDNHESALSAIITAIGGTMPDLEVRIIGHRVVHGGVNYAAPVAVTDAIYQELEALCPLAPLHQPHNLAGIRAATAHFPAAKQIACFDTAFHRSHPFVNDTFALPRRFFDEGVRRYGFHGLSYDYITAELKRRAPSLAEGRIIIAHLGNGASMCAVRDGRSVASTMGFSALDGLPMGTRCGQLDPGVLLYLMDQKGMDAKAIANLLYKESGLLGLSGLSNDMRTLEASDKAEAKETIDYFVFRIQRELGGLAAVLGGLDALVFSGGIGENSRLIRARVCERLDWIGIEIDHARNAANDFIISAPLSRTHVLVVPTNEEAVIFRACENALSTPS